MDNKKGPLAGVRVLDLTRALAGPYATMMLADMGAETIKIEIPNTGDETRQWGPPFLNGESAYFLSVNRNKKGMTLNLKSEKGKEIFRELAMKSDVVVENFRPGTMDKLGLGYDQLRESNSGLIYAAISGFGATGVYKDRPGYDQILQGIGGIMSITGPNEDTPTKVGIPIADIASGMFAAFGVTNALYHREKSGQGQMVDTSLYEGQIALLTFQAGRYFATGEAPRGKGNHHPLIAPYGTFKAKDGPINIAVGNNKLWEKFCETVGLSEIVSNPKFATNPDRLKNRGELISIIENTFKEKQAEEWIAGLEEAGIPCGPIYTIDDIFSDQQTHDREMAVEMDHPKSGRIKVTGVPIKLSETPGAVVSPPPLLGEHNVDILSNLLGYRETEIDELKSQGIL